ncbi:hypothetical protein JVU11DRAFT_10071 [Chiua virens]|nr:hypothetical protein JVU11DRAFT_10071 [Chiua virens]
MGMGFQMVNESWEEYLCNAECTYHKLEGKVKEHLVDLVEEAKSMMEDEWTLRRHWNRQAHRNSRTASKGGRDISDWIV